MRTRWLVAGALLCSLGCVTPDRSDGGSRDRLAEDAVDEPEMIEHEGSDDAAVVGDEPFDPLRVHSNALVVDGHNDLPWRLRGLWGLDLEPVQFDRRWSDGHTDLPRLREGGVDLQFWAAYVPVRFRGADGPRVAREQDRSDRFR